MEDKEFNKLKDFFLKEIGILNNRIFSMQKIIENLFERINLIEAQGKYKFEIKNEFIEGIIKKLKESE